TAILPAASSCSRDGCQRGLFSSPLAVASSRSQQPQEMMPIKLLTLPGDLFRLIGYCTALIAFFLTSPMVKRGSLAPVRGAIHFFSEVMISINSFLSVAVGIQVVSNCWRYSFSSIGSPVWGWKSCPFQCPMLRLNLMFGQ